MNLWPVVAPLLQRTYHNKRREWLEVASKVHPNVKPWPRRRSSRRKPSPGVHDLALQDDG